MAESQSKALNTLSSFYHLPHSYFYTLSAINPPTYLHASESLSGERLNGATAILINYL